MWSGWEGDITSGIRINLPVAKNPDGSAVTGGVRAEYILTTPASTVSVTAAPPYEAIGTNNAGANLTKRVHQDDPKEPIDNGDWAFADCSATPFPGIPSTTQVCLKGGFDTNHIYELVYTAKNPTVTGVGFAATRDFISFLRNRNGEHRGEHTRDRKMVSAELSPANPLDKSINYAIIYGSSQSGRWIRTYLQLGFNEADDHDPVVEGAIPHKASNRGAFNIRFAQPTRLSGTQHTERQYPGQESPQTWGNSYDPIAGIFAGQLDRCRKSDTCPKITATETDTEYWQALMALNTSDAKGKRDFSIPSNVRIYHFAGTQHGGGDPLNQPPAVLPSAPVNCQLLANSNPFIPTQRALLVALQQWIVHGIEPPRSLYPTLSRGSLVPASQINISYIPAGKFHTTGTRDSKVPSRSRSRVRRKGCFGHHG